MNDVSPARPRTDPTPCEGGESDAPTDRSVTVGADRLTPKRLVKYAALVLLVLVGGAAVIAWLVDRWTHVYITDSRIASTIVTVSSEVAGRVTRAPLTAGDGIEKGALLVQIETEEAELELERTASSLTRLDAQRAQLHAEQEMIRKQVQSRLRAARATIAAAEAAHLGSESELETARNELARVGSLHDRGVVSNERFEDIRGRFRVAVQAEHKAAAEVRKARADLTVAEADAGRIEVLEHQIGAVRAEMKALAARRKQQRIDLDKRTLRAPITGVVDQSFVDAGEYVTPGRRLLMYHDPDRIWVDANVKETDFGRLRIGAPATVTVDAYPGTEFKGSLIRLGTAATSEFALLPSPNPSGNFTKTTQRIPIRIAIEQREGLLRPGMMVEVSIDADD